MRGFALTDAACSGTLVLTASEAAVTVDERHTALRVAGATLEPATQSSQTRQYANTTIRIVPRGACRVSCPCPGAYAVGTVDALTLTQGRVHFAPHANLTRPGWTLDEADALAATGALQVSGTLVVSVWNATLSITSDAGAATLDTGFFPDHAASEVHTSGMSVEVFLSLTGGIAYVPGAVLGQAHLAVGSAGVAVGGDTLAGPADIVVRNGAGHLVVATARAALPAGSTAWWPLVLGLVALAVPGVALDRLLAARYAASDHAGVLRLVRWTRVLAPWRRSGWIMQAVALLRLGRPQEAQRLLGSRPRPGKAMWRFLAASAAAAQGDATAARSHLAACLALDRRFLTHARSHRALSLVLDEASEDAYA